MATANDLVIEEDDFQKFKEFFYRKTGIHFDDSKRYFVDKRLIERMQATASDSFRSYFVTLRFQANGGELQELINAMTVNETYFFREEYHFQTMVRHMLPEIASRKKNGEPIRIWSSPCSSGEEPYSMSIYIQEFWKDLEKYDVEILASDIDTSILQQAQRGIYTKRSVQNMPTNIVHKYFKQKNDNEFHLEEDTRASVEFHRINVTETADVRRLKKVDIIFCRNLLIYFDDVSRRTTAEAFYDALNPGGFICLGHSESMSRISGLFKVRKFPESIVYQKPLQGEKGSL